MNRRLEVLFDGRPIRTPISGVARYCIELSNALACLGKKNNEELNIALYCQNSSGSNIDLEKIQPSLSSELHVDLAFNSRLKNIAWEVLPNLVHRAEFDRHFDIIHETYFAGLGSSRRNGVKSAKVSTIHDVIPVDHPEWFNFSNRYFSKRNLQRQCREADHIICVSEYTKNRVKDFFPSVSDISVVPLGVTVPTDSIDLQYIEDLEIQAGSYLFYVGNIEPRKNLSRYVASIGAILEKNPELKFVIAGYMNYQANLILEPLLAEFPSQIIYLGAVNEAVKWSLLKYAKLAVFPSLYEGFGIPVIEAYSVGTPIVFSDCSSLTELLVSKEHVFDPLDSDNIREVTENALYSTDLRQEIVERGLKKAARYSWRQAALDTFEIYGSLAG